MPRRNAFYMFMEERRPGIIESGVVLTKGRAELAKMLNEEWYRLPRREKNRYEELARKYNEKNAKEKHAKENTAPPPRAPKPAAPQEPPQAPKKPAAPQEPPQTPKKPAAPQEPPQTPKKPAAPQEPVAAAVARAPMTVERPKMVLRDPYSLSSKIYLERLQKANRRYVVELFNSEWVTHPIVVCSFNTYFDPKYGQVYAPAEIGLATFTFRDGVMDNFGRVIDSGPPPTGYGVEVAKTIEKLGLPHPGFPGNDFGNLEALMRIVDAYLNKYRGQLPREAVYVFALDDDFELVTRCLDWLMKKTGRTCPFRVLSLSLYAYLASTNSQMKVPTDVSSLFTNVSIYRRAGKSLNDCFIHPSTHPMTQYGLFTNEQEVTELLKNSDNYKYYDELCCMYHFKKQDGAPFCALNASNRYAFYLMEVLTLSSEIEVIPGGHYPQLKERYAEIARRHGWLTKWGLTEMEAIMHYPPLLGLKIAQVGPLRHSMLSAKEPMQMRSMPVNTGAGVDSYEEPADPNEFEQGGYPDGSGSPPLWFKHGSSGPWPSASGFPPLSELSASQPMSPNPGSPPPWAGPASFMPCMHPNPGSPQCMNPMHGIGMPLMQTTGSPHPWFGHGHGPFMPLPPNLGALPFWPGYGSQQLPTRSGFSPQMFWQGPHQPMQTSDQASGQDPFQFHDELGAAALPGIVPLSGGPLLTNNPYQGTPPDVYVNPTGPAPRFFPRFHQKKRDSDGKSE